MKTFIILLATAVVLTLAFEVHCQEAHVVALTPADASSAKITWEQLQAAQKAWDAEQKRIALKYLIVTPHDPEATSTKFDEPIFPTSATITITSSDHVHTSLDTPPDELARQEAEHRAEVYRQSKLNRKRRGFDDNCSTCIPKFQFSHDFKYIVPPKPEPVTQTPGWGPLGIFTHSDALRPEDLPNSSH